MPASRRRFRFVGVLAVAATASWTTTEAQQPPTGGQPGTKWGDAQIKQAVAPLRVARKLTPRTWPNGAKVAVCLSFDVDNEYLQRGTPEPVPMTAGEFGAVSGVPRILALLDRHAIPASFYIPASSAINHPDMMTALRKSGRHEIAPHGWIHENLPALNDAAEEERLLTQQFDYFTKLLGKKPVGFRAPSWAWSHHTLPLLLKMGLLYDSSLMSMDEPYEIASNGKPTGLIELPVEWILDDAPYFGRTGALPSPEMIFQVYRDEFDMALREGTMLMLTMHPHVIGHRSRMVHLEKLVEYMKSKPGVWFATAEQIARYVKDQQQSSQ